MKIQKCHLTVILLITIIMQPIQFAVSASYKDAPNLEPFSLTQEVISKLTKIDANGSKNSSFRLSGITITAEKPAGNSITLSVVADPRLNLWRGRANDIASSHLGSMELIINSVIDENSENIHDTSRDESWSHRITIYNRGNGVFNGSRAVYFKKVSTGANIKQISGKIQLSLPVNLTKYVIKAGDPKSTIPLLERDSISEVKLKNGIYIEHPKHTPRFKIIIMGFNSKGERISVVSAGSPISNINNHWYYFSNEVTFDEMKIFIPEKFIDLEIPFSIDVHSE